MAAICLCSCSNSDSSETAMTNNPTTFYIQQESEIPNNSENPGVIKYYVDTIDGEDIYVDVSVKSFQIMDGQITGVDFDALKSVPEQFVSPDGTLAEGRTFAAVTITLKSDRDLEKIYINSMRLVSESKDLNAESFYNDGYEGNNPHDGGTVSLKANEEKTVTIGFFLKSETADANDFCLSPMLTNSDREPPQAIDLMSLKID
jgi:hypothetical protein